jgi:hypothetical protein
MLAESEAMKKTETPSRSTVDQIPVIEAEDLDPGMVVRR